MTKQDENGCSMVVMVLFFVVELMVVSDGCVRRCLREEKVGD